MRAAGGVHAVHAAAQGHYGVPPATYMSDPVIQESLSPFFQPVGIDVTRLPLTNPPIFQSSLASYNGPPQRRRISISNGQIGQLGHMGQLDDEDVMESIYDLQPPPLPQRRNGAKPFSKPVVSHEQFLARQHPPSYQAAYVDVAPGKPAEGHGAAYAGSVSSAPLHPHPEQPLTRPAHVLDAMASGPDFPRAASSSSLPTLYDAPPGTAAWKRARLLERNRIAASKCRQRKKIAQLQLQKDVDILTKENKEIRRELEYYQKLVSKFKRFIELHMETCNGSNGGVQIIEEMLKIDHSIVGQENDSGDKRDTSEEAPI
ncbi:ADL104Wp [Eremothecium gossypii ATCC 10895]|uniref:ADL104Wp n=1 Tax=Eremothecium gossypii (strain ATCC 10895 / CBS 109.51 / FGSC 9923 / NRRL Y-1056) TaxID=284811 RepID=Q75AM7_EREGS|nr:ADL104Wp [Eremothecium gossypii ATCC 10895]AAS51816.2 ADL104Wp [Eremothecium gossypii ATCC 10895]AEY96113.1 FADL104Wp [Eremothecium gossypii FDAG1]